MGILLVYDVTDEASFNNIRNWMRNIEQHASDNVNKVRGGTRLWKQRAEVGRALPCRLTAALLGSRSARLCVAH